MPSKSRLSTDDITRFVATVYIIAANKGGTGKSTVTRVIIDGHEEKGAPYILMETDIGIPDTARLYGVRQGYDIDTPEGWYELYEALAAAPKNVTVIVTTPGGFLQRAKTHSPAILQVLSLLPNYLARPVRVVWVGDDKRDVIESLREFREVTGGKLPIDFVKNEKYCPAAQFKFFDDSEEKKILEANGGMVYRLPLLGTRAAQLMTNARLKGSEMRHHADLFTRVEYEQWWNTTVPIFQAAGYIP